MSATTTAGYPVAQVLARIAARSAMWRSGLAIGGQLSVVPAIGRL
jgi:hypothetical protein